MQPLNLIAYVCIATGVLAMIPWRTCFVATKRLVLRTSKPSVESPSVIVDAAPEGSAAYVQALRAELVKESPEFVLDCATKGLSVTESIREAYLR